MQLIPESKNLNDYLISSEIINYNHPAIQTLSQELKKETNNEISLIKIMFEYVRDQIPHSFDINGKFVTYIASDVLKYKEGICYPKSHLLAALLRSAGFPAGFCYQKLILDDELYPFLVYHGLNAVFVESENRWIRLDARGNKEGLTAQFSLDKEQLAFIVRKELGEIDFETIYVHPLQVIIDSLSHSKTIQELRNHLPQ